MIRVLVDEKGTVLRLLGVPAKASQRLRVAISREVIELANHIKDQKLSGQVLKNRTGALRRSTRAYPPTMAGSAIRGEVAVDKTTSVYGKVHEFGGTYRIPAHTRRNRGQRRLRVSEHGAMRTHQVREHTATFKERSFMRSSLEERRHRILESLKRAVHEAVSA